MVGSLRWSAALLGAALAMIPAGPFSAPAPDRPAEAQNTDRAYPRVPADPLAAAALLRGVEEALRDPATPATALPGLGHQQQVIYRVLARDGPRAQAVLAQVPPRWRPVARHQLAARHAFLAMRRGRAGLTSLPAWRIIPPAPAEALLAHYRKAAAASGIPWEVLAAINLVETGMGRIDGVSVAGARGPMQFLPSTWAEAGIGRGDIRDPHDAIQAAARYLVRRGGRSNLRQALWGYNNSDHYGQAVLHYAAVLKDDPRAFRGFYHWEIHLDTASGDIWLPVGYRQLRPIPVATYLAQVPSSAPP